MEASQRHGPVDTLLAGITVDFDPESDLRDKIVAFGRKTGIVLGPNLEDLAAAVKAFNESKPQFERVLAGAPQHTTSILFVRMTGLAVLLDMNSRGVAHPVCHRVGEALNEVEVALGLPAEKPQKPG